MKLSLFASSSIGKKSIMSGTGALLGSFLLTHLAGNSTMFLGRDSFISYAEHLHSLGVLLHFFEIGLALIFSFHVIFAIQIYLENLHARPIKYAVNRSSGGRTIASQTMPYTGLLILLFVIVHLATFHFTDHSITIADIVRNNLKNPIMCIYYIISLIALGTHLSHGFWSFFQSLGMNHPNYNTFLRQSAVVVSVLCTVVYLAIPVLTLLFSNFLL